MTAPTDPHWKQTILAKRNTQLNSIPSSWRLSEEVLNHTPVSSIQIIQSSGILTPDEIAWTETTDIRDLVSLITSRRVSSEQLTTAFCKRAAIAQQVTKCLTEIFFDKALADARALDQHLERTGKVVGPLHGIPVSVKDRFDIQGVDTTVGKFYSPSHLFKHPFIFSSYTIFSGLMTETRNTGWVGLIGKPARKSSSIVQLLEALGAVMYVKTNIPQSLMVSISLFHLHIIFPISNNTSDGRLI